MEKSRETSIDLLECIAIFLVLMRHSILYTCNILSPISILDYLRTFVNVLYPCSIPAFFFANGYLLLNRPFNLKKHIYRIIRLLILTAVWGILTVLLYMPIKGVSLSFSEIIMKVWHWEEGWTNHLWFMGALVCVYIFFPLLKVTWDSNKNIFLFFTIVVFAMTIGNEMINVGLTIFSSVFLHKDTAFESLNFFNIFNPFRYIHGYTFAYFCIGGYACYYKEKILTISVSKRNISAVIMILLAAILCMWVNTLYSRIYGVIQESVWNRFSAFPVFVMLLSIWILCLNHTRNTIVIRTISNNTIGIYFLHGLMINATLSLIPQTPFFHTVLFNIIYVAIVISACLVIIQILKKIPILKKLVS